MIRFKDEDYAYATARIRALETKMLDSSQMNKMIESQSAEDALKILTEAGYGENSFEASNIYEYERLLSEEMQKTYGLLLELAPSPAIFDLFRQKDDYLNAKIILKAEFLGVAPELLIKTGKIDPAFMRVIIRERDLTHLPLKMREALEETLETFSRTSDPQVIDLILDYAAHEQLIDGVSNLDNDYVKRIINIMTDFTNIRTFIRVKALKRSWDFLRKVLLPGGSIPKSRYFEFVNKNWDAFVESLKFTMYGDVIERGFEDFKAGNSISVFEKLFDDYLMVNLKKAKFIAMGIEPLLGYFLAKGIEIKNVRIIMTGKINKILPERIKERLRISYV